MATALILDGEITDQIIRDREQRGINQFDEVWEGVYVVSPLADLEHQYISGILTSILVEVVQVPGLGRVYPGANVSDREHDWKDNFRVPDVVVVLRNGKARDCGTHFCGGPDFLIEILSDDDKSYDKLEFYAAIGVRELLVVDPDTRRVELFRLSGGKLSLVGRSSQDAPRPISSSVVPLTFQWVAGATRPTIAVERTDGKSGSWSE